MNGYRAYVLYSFLFPLTFLPEPERQLRKDSFGICGVVRRDLFAVESFHERFGRAVQGNAAAIDDYASDGSGANALSRNSSSAVKELASVLDCQFPFFDYFSVIAAASASAATLVCESRLGN